MKVLKPSDGMKIAVLASHAPDSIRNVVRLATGSAGGKYRVVRQNMSTCLEFGRIFDIDGRGVESEPSSASAAPMDVVPVGKGKEKGCFVCGRPSHAAKDCKPNHGKGKGQSKGKTKNTTDKNSRAKFRGVSPLRQERPQMGRLLETSGRSERQETPRR